MDPIVIRVLGTPAPKGSGRAIMIAGRAVMVPSGSNVNRNQLKSWDTALREAALAAIGNVTSPPFINTALRVRIVFRMARPSGHWGARGLKPSAPQYPATKPDLDKLARSTCDTLTGIVFDDDSRIVRAHSDKVYADPGQEGATIYVSAMPPPVLDSEPVG